jgi:hypothetical protein
LKSLDLFFDDTVITEIVTWTNRKIENVKTSYTSMTEIRALIGILLFLGATKSSKESTASIWAKDGPGHEAEIPKAHFGWHDEKEQSVHSTKLSGESR